MPTIIPDVSRAGRAVDFVNNTNVWIGLGRTTAWDNEENPPTPLSSDTTLDEPVLYKQATAVIVEEDSSSGTILVYQGETLKKYSTVATSAAITAGVSSVYVTVTFFDTDFTAAATTYRQTGIFSSLIASAGYTAETTLIPDEVAYPGVLEWKLNHEVITVQSAQVDLVQVVLTF